ncbi:SGNH/GDSL hydrolase family protein [Humibacter ginsenosidimutans]|uniref:SGNH/GDSL hydrolase family protein n=1 Tax=Humibacter ginsenosidimutans TaxID=2599293 RepID=A0A5B8M1B0_9MICO|nr:SGNH/GDSL hydrolase family protein [Humibacter ginsenosidimutans]QDZ13811.1 SGNH/GDSL hydrolase family protein [Humibacter ginsenosidimutans]
MYTSYVAIGDSFTEGVGDVLPDGRVRGWADLVAAGLAAAADEPVLYANLAIRGRKLAPIVGEQLDAALTLHPQLLSINGGGNDIMRPKVSIDDVAAQTSVAVSKAVDAGIHVLLLSGANPSDNLPGGRTMQRRGDELADRVRATIPEHGVTFVDNFADAGLRDLRYWSVDRLHLNAFGHARVASNVLTALGVPVPVAWQVDEVAAQSPLGRRAPSPAYYREYVLPWIGRRLTGRSSGDGRVAKLAELTPVDPQIVF